MPPPRPIGGRMLELRGVTTGYGDPSRATPVLSDFHLRVAPGQRWGLLGPSGSGKTTITRLLSFQLPLWAGSYQLDGEPVTATGWDVPAAVRRRVGLVFQSARAAANPRMRLRTAITEPLRCLPGALRPDGEAAGERLAAALDLARFPSDLLDRLPAEVSEGELARAMLARAVIAEPRYLVSDEPTASLDPATAAAVWDALGQLADNGVAVLVVSHHEADLVRWTDRLLRLAGQRRA